MKYQGVVLLAVLFLVVRGTIVSDLGTLTTEDLLTANTGDRIKVSEGLFTVPQINTGYKMAVTSNYTLSTGHIEFVTDSVDIDFIGPTSSSPCVSGGVFVPRNVTARGNLLSQFTSQVSYSVESAICCRIQIDSITATPGFGRKIRLLNANPYTTIDNPIIISDHAFAGKLSSLCIAQLALAMAPELESDLLTELLAPPAPSRKRSLAGLANWKSAKISVRVLRRTSGEGGLSDVVMAAPRTFDAGAAALRQSCIGTTTNATLFSSQNHVLDVVAITMSDPTYCLIRYNSTTLKAIKISALVNSSDCLPSQMGYVKVQDSINPTMQRAFITGRDYAFLIPGLSNGIASASVVNDNIMAALCGCTTVPFSISFVQLAGGDYSTFWAANIPTSITLDTTPSTNALAFTCMAMAAAGQTTAFALRVPSGQGFPSSNDEKSIQISCNNPSGCAATLMTTYSGCGSIAVYINTVPGVASPNVTTNFTATSYNSSAPEPFNGMPRYLHVNLVVPAQAVYTFVSLPGSCSVPSISFANPGLAGGSYGVSCKNASASFDSLTINLVNSSSLNVNVTECHSGPSCSLTALNDTLVVTQLSSRFQPYNSATPQDTLTATLADVSTCSMLSVLPCPTQFSLLGSSSSGIDTDTALEALYTTLDISLLFRRRTDGSLDFENQTISAGTDQLLATLASVNVALTNSSGLLNGTDSNLIWAAPLATILRTAGYGGCITEELVSRISVPFFASTAILTVAGAAPRTVSTAPWVTTLRRVISTAIIQRREPSRKRSFDTGGINIVDSVNPLNINDTITINATAAVFTAALATIDPLFFGGSFDALDQLMDNVANAEVTLQGRVLSLKPATRTLDDSTGCVIAPDFMNVTRFELLTRVNSTTLDKFLKTFFFVGVTNTTLNNITSSFLSGGMTNANQTVDQATGSIAANFTSKLVGFRSHQSFSMCPNSTTVIIVDTFNLALFTNDPRVHLSRDLCDVDEILFSPQIDILKLMHTNVVLADWWIGRISNSTIRAAVSAYKLAFPTLGNSVPFTYTTDVARVAVTSYLLNGNFSSFTQPSDALQVLAYDSDSIQTVKTALRCGTEKPRIRAEDAQSNIYELYSTSSTVTIVGLTPISNGNSSAYFMTSVPTDSPTAAPTTVIVGYVTTDEFNAYKNTAYVGIIIGAIALLASVVVFFGTTCMKF